MAGTNNKTTLGIQDTGNPVFDATCNLVMNWPSTINFHTGGIHGLHKDLIALYEKEPKRVNPPERKSVAQMQREAQEAERRIH